MKGRSDQENDPQKMIFSDMILEMTPTMVVFLDAGNAVQKISKTASVYFGLDNTSVVVGKSIFKLISDLVLLLLMKRWIQMLDQGESIQEIFPIAERGTGRYQWISVKAAPVFQDNELMYKGFFLNDVTELYGQKKILDALMVSIPGTVLVFDRDLRILFASESVAYGNGFSSWRDMTGHSLRELTTINVEEIEHMLDRLIVTDIPIQQTLKNESPEHGIHWYHADLRIIKASAWTFGYILTLFDITNEIKPKAILEALMDSTVSVQFFL